MEMKSIIIWCGVYCSIVCIVVASPASEKREPTGFQGGYSLGQQQNTNHVGMYHGAYNFEDRKQHTTIHQGQEKHARALSSTFEFNPFDSNYIYSYETDNGLAARAHGYKNKNEDLVVEGSYMAVGPDEKMTKITYIADENGFQASGAGIPTIPPIIKKALDYLKSLPPSPTPFLPSRPPKSRFYHYSR